MLLQLTLPQAIKKIREEEFPYWDLYCYTDAYGGAKKPFSFYYGNDIEASVKKLTSDVNNTLNADALRWNIIIRKAKTSSGSGIIEFDFLLKAPVEAGIQGVQQPPVQQPYPAMGGLGALDMHNNYLNERKSDLGQLQVRLNSKEDNLAERERELNTKNFTYEIAKNQLEVERRAFDEKVKDSKKQLETLATKYNSNTAAAQEAMSQFFVKVVKTFGENGDLSGLVGIPAEKKEEAPLTADEIIVNGLADKLYTLTGEPLKEICSYAETLADESLANQFTADELGRIIGPSALALKEVVKEKNAA